eukprot:COSAG02_NODE_1950_length_10291_cov_13.985381_8_plen_76_part_00
MNNVVEKRFVQWIVLCSRGVHRTDPRDSTKSKLISGLLRGKDSLGLIDPYSEVHPKKLAVSPRPSQPCWRTPPLG